MPRANAWCSPQCPSFSTPPTEPGYSNVVDVSGRKWRAFAQDKDNGLRIWVGERDDVRSDLVERIVRHTLWPNVLGSLILAAMVWLAIGWGLKPWPIWRRSCARHSGSWNRCN
jgi:two-component system sensor histidine kinase QseC